MSGVTHASELDRAPSPDYETYEEYLEDQGRGYRDDDHDDYADNMRKKHDLIDFNQPRPEDDASESSATAGKTDGDLTTTSQQSAQRDEASKTAEGGDQKLASASDIAKAYDIVAPNLQTQETTERVIKTINGAKMPHFSYGVNLQCALYTLALCIADAEKDHTCVYERLRCASDIMNALSEIMARPTWQSDVETVETAQFDEDHKRAYLAARQDVLTETNLGAIHNLELNAMVALLKTYENDFMTDPGRYSLKVLCKTSNLKLSSAYDIKHSTRSDVPPERTQLVIQTISGVHYEPLIRTIDDEMESSTGHARSTTSFHKTNDPLLNGGHVPAHHDCARSPPCRFSQVERMPANNNNTTVTAPSPLWLMTPQQLVEASERDLREAEAKDTAMTIKFRGKTIHKPTETVPIPTYDEAQKATSDAELDRLGKAKLIKLRYIKTKTEEWSLMRDTYAQTLCQVVHEDPATGNSHQFPPLKNPLDEQTAYGFVSLTVNFATMATSPGIKVSYHMRQASQSQRGKDITHTGSATFFFGIMYDHLRKVDYHGVDAEHSRFQITQFDETDDQNRTYQGFDLVFRSYGAVGANIVPPPEFPTTAVQKAAVGLFQQWIRGSPNGQMVHLRLRPHSKYIDGSATSPLYEAVKLLPGGAREMPSLSKVPNWPYKRTNAVKGNTADVKIAYDQMLSPLTIIKSSPRYPYAAHPPVKGRFNDCRQGEGFLGYGENNEHQNEVAKFAQLNINQHVANFYTVSDFGIGAIFWSLPPKPGLIEAEKFTVPADTKVKISIETEAELLPVEVMGYTTDNDFGIPGADMVVIFAGSALSKIHHISSWYGSKKFAPYKDYTVRIQAEVNDSVIKHKLDAVRKVYDPNLSEGTRGALLPILNYDGDSENVGAYDTQFNPYQQMRKPGAAEKAQNFFEGAETWEPSQLKAVKSSSKMLSSKYHPCGIASVTGAGGSGKTVMQVDEGEAIVKHSDDCVIYCAERNSVCDVIVENINKKFPKANPIDWPVRYFAKKLKPHELARRPQAQPSRRDIGADESAIVAILKAKQDKRLDQRRGKVAFSVESHMSYRIEAESVCMRQIMQGFTAHPTWPDKINIYTLLDQFIKLLEWRGYNYKIASDAPDSTAEDIFNKPVPTPSTESGGRLAADGTKPYWSDDHVKVLRQLYDFAEADILRNARKLCITFAACGDQAVRQNFAPNPESNVWLQADEAQNVTEATFLIPIGKNWSTWGSRVVSIKLYGDPQQLGAPVPGQQGDYNELNPGVNEFQQQIKQDPLKRLIACGVPSTQLTTQHRMHRVIFTPAGDICYEGQILSADRQQAFALPPAYIEALPNILGFEGPFNRMQERLYGIETAGDTQRISQSSGTRMNLATLLSTLEITDVLYKVFGDQMIEKCMVITGYRGQLQAYNAHYNKDMIEKGLPYSARPRVSTIDAAGGSEADIVIFDTVVHNHSRKGIGFLKEKARVCVAVTRPKKAFIVICANNTGFRYHPDNKPDVADEGSANGAGDGSAQDNKSQQTDDGAAHDNKSDLAGNGSAQDNKSQHTDDGSKQDNKSQHTDDGSQQDIKNDPAGDSSEQEKTETVEAWLDKQPDPKALNPPSPKQSSAWQADGGDPFGSQQPESGFQADAGGFEAGAGGFAADTTGSAPAKQATWAKEGEQTLGDNDKPDRNTPALLQYINHLKQHNCYATRELPAGYHQLDVPREYWLPEELEALARVLKVEGIDEDTLEVDYTGALKIDEEVKTKVVAEVFNIFAEHEAEQAKQDGDEQDGDEQAGDEQAGDEQAGWGSPGQEQSASEHNSEDEKVEDEKVDGEKVDGEN